MFTQKLVLMALACVVAGAGHAADSARDKANERNADAGRTASTPAVGCDRLQGPERTACLAKGQSPMGEPGTGASSGDTVTKKNQAQRKAAAKKPKKKASAKHRSSRPAGKDRSSYGETATGVTSGAAQSGDAGNPPRRQSSQ